MPNSFQVLRVVLVWLHISICLGFKWKHSSIFYLCQTDITAYRYYCSNQKWTSKRSSVLHLMTVYLSICSISSGCALHKLHLGDDTLSLGTVCFRSNHWFICRPYSLEYRLPVFWGRSVSRQPKQPPPPLGFTFGFSIVIVFCSPPSWSLLFLL